MKCSKQKKQNDSMGTETRPIYMLPIRDTSDLDTHTTVWKDMERYTMKLKSK